jgi:hypothetical protein
MSEACLACSAAQPLQLLRMSLLERLVWLCLEHCLLLFRCCHVLSGGTVGILVGSKSGVLDAVCSAHPGSVKVGATRGAGSTPHGRRMAPMCHVCGLVHVLY